MTPPFLELRDIRKEYGKLAVMHGISLDIARGEFLTFLGPSGSGKSTTLFILAGFQEPTSGDILLEGRTLLSTPSHKRNIGMVFQRYTLFPNLSVGENIAFPLRIRRRPRAEIAEKVRRLLKLIRLEGFEDRMPGQMSGGQQQRVALARALAYDPLVLLMDEPLSALDKKLREELQFEIRRIHRETGVTILYVTHDQEEALRLSDRIAVFSKGVIDQVGTGVDLYANPATRFVAEFVGDSNFLTCDILDCRDGMAVIRLEDGTIAEAVPLHGALSEKAKVRENLHRGSLMLRPERLSLATARHASSEEQVSTLSAILRDMTFLGNVVELQLATVWGAPLAVRVPFGHAGLNGLAIGAKVEICWASRMAHAFVEAGEELDCPVLNRPGFTEE